MKRSISPLFWLPFGAGGMLACVLGPALVLTTGLLAPAGLGLGELLAWPRVQALATHPLGKLALWVVISLFAWHGAERIYLTLRDMRVAPRSALMWMSYGGAAVVTGVALVALLRIGF